MITCSSVFRLKDEIRGLNNVVEKLKITWVANKNYLT